MKRREATREILSKFRMMLMMSINFNARRKRRTAEKNLNSTKHPRSALINVWRMSGIDAEASLKAFFFCFVSAPKIKWKLKTIEIKETLRKKALTKWKEKNSHGSGSNVTRRAAWNVDNIVAALSCSIKKRKILSCRDLLRPFVTQTNIKWNEQKESPRSTSNKKHPNE